MLKGETNIFDTALSPALIKSRIELFYFGANQAIETISRVFYEQWLLIKQGNKQILPKRNTLLIGPSGCGKTYLIKKMAEFFDLPFVSYDVTKMSRTGYVGDKVEDFLSLLYKKANLSLEKMKNGIVFLDEVDKLAANLQYGSAELSTTGVQLDLLKFIEGDNYKFNTLGHRDYSSKETPHDFDSSNLLIICGGAFEGIEGFIEKRKKKNTFGFVGYDKDGQYDCDTISTEDLIEYGLIKEFAARFQIVITLAERSADELYDILANAEDSVLKNYKEYFYVHECELIVEDEALKEIAKYAFEQRIGARGIIRILEKVLPMYSVANKMFTKFNLTKEIVINKLSNVK
jgi:ATP-dependent Clp protease ATP-binding subunit ClpX